MPPWHADPAVGTSRTSGSLSDADTTTLMRWANSGAPKGDPKDLPPIPKYTEGWTIGEPDLVLAMPVEYKVPADGFVEYEYFEIPTNFTEDKWVQSVEVRARRPRGRASRHRDGAAGQTRATTGEDSRSPKGWRFRKDRPAPAPPRQDIDPKHGKGQSLFPAPQRLGVFVGAYAPGTSVFKYEPGAATLIRAGSTLVMQMHYTPNGKETIDRTKIGLTFARSPRRPRCGSARSSTVS